MRVTIVGTGFIGSTLGRAFSVAGHTITYGSRHPDDDRVEDRPGDVLSFTAALAGADVVVLAIPGAAVASFSAAHDVDLAGKLVIDATNQMGKEVSNARGDLPPTVRYARAFNTLGGENFANPEFPAGTADLFFSAAATDEPVVAELIAAVGLGPVYVGEDQEALIDALFRLWIQLAMAQGRGRHLALKLLHD